MIVKTIIIEIHLTNDFLYISINNLSQNFPCSLDHSTVCNFSEKYFTKYFKNIFRKNTLQNTSNIFKKYIVYILCDHMHSTINLCL